MGSTHEKKSKIIEWREKIETGEIEVEDYYKKLIEDIKRINKKLAAFRVIIEFSEIQPYLRKNIYNYLRGFPYHAKDNICTKGIETTAGSKILKGYIPPYSATVIERMFSNGGTLIGKTNMDEFGFGTFSINSAYGIPKNPFNTNLVAGGSSGGAGVATAIMEYSIALAVSTGGSISCPASFNGVVGFTPTYGVVSRWGLIDYANSLDKIGIMAKYTKDVEIVFSLIRGIDGKDSIVQDVHEKFKPIKIKEDIKIGVPTDILDNCDNTVLKYFWHSLEKMAEEYKVTYENIKIQSLKYAIPAYYIISTSEASTNLARYCGMRYGKQLGNYEKHFDDFFSEHRSKFFGEEAKRRIILGTFARMAGYRDKYYLKALKIRRVLINEYKQLFKNYDVIATPSMPILAPEIYRAKELSPIETYMLDVFTVPPNLCGFPHISLPIGYEKSPIGIQYTADHYYEKILFKIGEMWETIFQYKFPSICVGVI